MKLIERYKNGNAIITLFDDGTRIIETPDNEEINLEFPLSMDCKITNSCPYGCAACHEKSIPNGKHGNIMEAKFIDRLHKGTEIAIGGGAVTSHPQLIPFLEKLKTIGVVPSITVNQREFKDNFELINKLVEDNLIYGLGVSFNSFDNEFWDKVIKSYPNLVIHLIAGIHGKDVLDYLTDKNAKILILGFKDFGRGHDLLQTSLKNEIEAKINWLKDNLKSYISKFKVVSFDNLALRQLSVKNILTDKEWAEFYQGDDGTATMYVDLVNEQFAKTSTSVQRYELKDTIEEMFNIIKENDNDLQ